MIRNALLFGLVVMLAAACKSATDIYMFTSFHEPANEGLRMLFSEDGYHWTDLGRTFLKPDAGPSKLMRDPSMIVGPDGIYHLVWTTGWKGDRGFGYASSRDLVHWSAQKFIPVMEHEPTVVNVWAPELFYDDKTKQFIVIWASTVPFRFEKGIEEENNNHRMYYTTTQDFNNFTRAELFLDPGFSVIDAVILKRDEADYVLVLKDNTRANRNLKVAFSDHALGPYKNISAPFSGNFTEGPSVLKFGDEWIIYFDAYREKKYGAVKTKDFITFTDVTAVVEIPPGHKHGTIFKTSKKHLDALRHLAATKDLSEIRTEK
jgi:hypothetical protein